MRTRTLLGALLAVLLAACGSVGPVVPPPRPSPGPAPIVEPTPSPGPTRPGRVVTEAEANAVPMGSGEAAIVALFGRPVRVVALPEDGVRMLVYHASTPTDPTRFAEFWLTDNRLTRTVVY